MTFEKAMNALLRQSGKECVGVSFHAKPETEVVEDELGRPVLRAGTIVMYQVLLATATQAGGRTIACVTDYEARKAFITSGDHIEFVRWLGSFMHTINGTEPDTSEKRAEKALDEVANAAFYTKLDEARTGVAAQSPF